MELKHELGPSGGVGFKPTPSQRWTNSSGYPYQLLPYQPLTDSLTHQVAARLARMMIVLQPLLEEADPRAARR
ncbi:MAG TPA: hypothetical protein VFI42_14815 [Thermomicrobiaceae bacterium]|nr:hypothetical protein [Thermomicrobiaceae bacterium]